MRAEQLDATVTAGRRLAHSRRASAYA
jgi:hypothetical protein